jgi:hypothetical protein
MGSAYFSLSLYRQTEDAMPHMYDGWWFFGMHLFWWLFCVMLLVLFFWLLMPVLRKRADEGSSYPEALGHQYGWKFAKAIIPRGLELNLSSCGTSGHSRAWQLLSPMIAAAAMSFSPVSVVGSALRLLRLQL